MGAAALDGRPGVVSVDRGWRGFSEINRVVYDPDQVSVEQMETWLRESGTYIRTVAEPPPESKENKEKQ